MIVVKNNHEKGNMFFTIEEEKIEAEIVEKKSKFIATLFYVQNEQQAQDIIKNIKKQYYDARHNCLAYRIMTENGILERFSDDGEPSRNSWRTNVKYTF